MKNKLLTYKENPEFKLFVQSSVQNFDFCTKSVPCGILDVPCGPVHQPNGQIFKGAPYGTPGVPCGTKGVPCGTIGCTTV